MTTSLLTVSALQGGYKNDLIGLEFDPLLPGSPKLTGKYIIERIYGIKIDHSKWVDLAIVFFILFCYRIAFFLVLKFRERASPLFRTIYAAAAVKHLMKKPSFQRKMSSLSKRHQPQNPLSVQEGLSSPLP